MTARQRRLERMRAIEREWLVASIAAERFGERLRANPSALAEKKLKNKDYRNFRDNLESHLSHPRLRGVRGRIARGMGTRISSGDESQDAGPDRCSICSV